MNEWIAIIPSILTVLTGAGWFTSRHLRKKQDEKHAVELERARAEADALRQRSELDYTKEVLEIYSAHIVQPLKEQIAFTNKRLDIYENAINKALRCSLYPNCPVIVQLQGKKGDNIDTRPSKAES